MKRSKDFDYHSYDRLSVTIKLDAETEIIKRYKSFGWEEIERVEDRRFFDVIHVLFQRPHKIPHKDELQLLQVDMELAVNRAAKLEINQSIKTASLALVSAASGCAMIAGGVIIATLINSLLAIISGAFLAAAGFAEIAAVIPLLPKLYKRERAEFEKKYNEATNEITAVCKSAAALTGGNNGK